MIRVTRPHIPRIDTLRAIAALSVIYIHYFVPMLPASAMIFPDGVQLFFVLSGFLIARNLLDESAFRSRGGTLTSFYIRRSFRIFPAYFATVAACVMFGIYGAVQSWPYALTFMIDFYTSLGIGNAGYLGHFWTLAVEEQFYIVLPLLMTTLPRRMIVFVVCGVIAAAIVFRMSRGYGPAVFAASVDPQYFRFNPMAEMDNLAIGVLAALASERFGLATVEKLLRKLLPLTVPSFLICCVVAVLDWRMRYFVLGLAAPISSVFFAWLIVRAVQDGPRAATWGGRILPRIGAMSYGIYLFHLPMLAAAAAVERGVPSIRWRIAAFFARLAGGLGIISMVRDALDPAGKAAGGFTKTGRGRQQLGFARRSVYRMLEQPADTQHGPHNTNRR